MQKKLEALLTEPLVFAQCCKVVNKQGKTVNFVPNIQQKELVEGLEKYNIILKSRQLGITTVSCMLSLYHAITKPNSHCMLISYSLDSASSIFDKLKQMYEDLPKPLKLKEVANNRSMLKFNNGSKITVCTLSSKELGRGSSICFCHISELAFAKQEMVKKQLLAIEQALLPNATLIIESTANGLNEFSDLWEKAENGDNLYKPFFFSWIDDKVMFADEYKAFSKRYIATKGHKLKESELDITEKAYFEQGASLEQLMWRRLKVANSSEESFRQEYPASPIEAFVTSGNNIFDGDNIQKQSNAKRNEKRFTNIKSISALLKPYLSSYLTIWKEPIRGMKYYIGVDASEGVGQDYSVITVLDADADQVAEFRTNRIQPFEIANITNEIGRYYNNALIVVEKASGGHIILDRLRNTYKYMNLYKSKQYDEKGRKVKKIGWTTSQKTKPILINDFVEFFVNGDVNIRSMSLLSEMKTYVFSNGSANAERGLHDDCVISMALSIQGLKSGVNYI